MYHQILSNLNMQKDHSSLNFDKLRLFACGSAPVSKDLSRRWLETLGKPLTARYGTTETGIVISQPLFTDSTIFSHKIENSVQYSEKVDFNDNSKVSSSLKYNASPIGKPIDKAVNISIKDGEMYIKSPTIGSHYLVSNNFQNSLSSSFESLEFTIPNSSLARNNDDFNDLILFPDPKFTPEIYTMPVTDDKGWFRTGDLVTTCEDGSLFFTGRKCDLINVAGNKVAPLTVETIIHHELSIHISDCAVVPLNCPIYGQKVALLYCTHNKQPIEGLKRILLRLLPTSFHVPSDIRLVDKIPRNFMGKIDRIEAAKRFESI